MSSEINADHGRNVLLVVVYEMQLAASSTIQSVVNYLQVQDSQTVAGYQLFIWDNSPISSDADVQSLRLQLPTLEMQYVHTPENYSLSKIYNEVASKLAENEYLTLLDQDSTLPSEYFSELKEAQIQGYSLILPQVKCGSILVSPGARFFCKGKLLENIKSGLVSSKNF